ncbi:MULTISPECIES: dihydropteroate synthase [Microbacterium]|uniref:dihydropteroate synthase n=1 Tax=Microbacterium TaxID=33882 RepID=UPI00217E91D5|nr:MULTISPECIES: dihydropteroate synthase [Microbacterium]UWF77756.1 dihydropteroate synthase [Microbacterium neungamense]WCM55923.1 dihydropteroate synthase [Microbacterium sp. EF45047]
MTGIWGILNITPDSFSDGGRYLDPGIAVAHARMLRAQGAAVVDVGGESTRPGAERVPEAEEQRRVLPVIEALTDAGIPVSIDTLNASTAVAAVRAGARYVNDVSGGLADERMLAAVADTDADVVLGHWRGPSSDMYARAQYTRAAREVAAELHDRIAAAAAAGIAPARVILDPGIGFAKSGTQNWEVLRGLDEIVGLGHRVLVGTSRKRFLGEILAAAPSSNDGADASTGSASEAGIPLARRDLATAVTSVLAARAGAWAVRVHDVASTRDALAVQRAWDGA